MRVVVTGAHGFIGARASAELRRRGYEVLSLGFRVGRPVSRPDVRYDGYLSSSAALDELTSLLSDWRPDGVLHLAGTTDAGRPEELFALNAGFPATLVEAMRRAGCMDRPVLLVGSAAEYGPLPRHLRPLDEEARTEPTSLYGISKLAQSRVGLAAAAQGQSVVVARVFNVIGAGMPEHLSVPSFARRLAVAAVERSGRPLPAGNLNAVRDFVPVQSVAEALADLLACRAAQGRVINICGGRPYRIGAVLERMIQLSGLAITADRTHTNTGMTDVAYGDPNLITTLTGWRAPALRNADLLAVMQEAGCPACGGSEDDDLPTVVPAHGETDDSYFPPAS